MLSWSDSRVFNDNLWLVHIILNSCLFQLLSAANDTMIMREMWNEDAKMILSLAVFSKSMRKKLMKLLIAQSESKVFFWLFHLGPVKVS